MSTPAPVLILSTGRSGSTLVSRLLSGGGAAVSHQAPGSRAVNIAGNLAAAGWLDPERAASFAGSAWGLDLTEASSDPLRSMLAAVRIRSGSGPPVRVVHVVRDPRDFVRSFMSWKRQSLKRSILHHLVPAWQPNPWMAGECGPLRWAAMSKFEHFCWVWAYKNAYFGSLVERCDYRRFRMEDLSTNRDGALKELFRFAGQEPPAGAGARPERVNPSRERFPAWREWTARRARQLAAHCGSLMAQYGYGGEPEWLALTAAPATPIHPS
jgi:hypothetical protein